MAQAKFRLHAKRVDRIAIVDRPAVPDAQIVLFKRMGGVEVTVPKALEFNSEFMLQGVDGAVIALENSFWSILFDMELEGAKKTEAFNTLFRDFSAALDSLVKLTKGQFEKQDAPIDEIEQGFKNTLRAAAISDAFMILRNHLGFFMVNAEQLGEDGPKLIERIVESFKSFVLEQAEAVITKKLHLEKSDILKVGRKISGSRLNRLKAALKVIDEIIIEAESSNKGKEDGSMDEAMKKAFEELAASVKSLTDGLAELKKSFEDSSALAVKLTERMDAAEKTLGTQEKPIAEALEAGRLQVEEAIRGNQEIKALVEEQGKSLAATTKKTDDMHKGFENLAKRMGQRTSSEGDPGGGGEHAEGDPFTKSVRSPGGAAKKKE